MRSTLRQLAAVTALSAGLLLAVPAAAQAATGPDCHRVHQQSTGNFGLLNGNQIYAPLDLGLDFSNNALGILGVASSSRGDTTYKLHCGN